MTSRTMSDPGNQQGYTLTARVLHWLTAVIVIGLIPAGIYMVDAPAGPTQDLVFNLHRSFGFLLLLIVIVRLFYRLGHRPPPLPAEMPAFQRDIAHTVHWTLYALLIVQPVIGWIGEVLGARWTLLLGGGLTIAGVLASVALFLHGRAAQATRAEMADGHPVAV